MSIASRIIGKLFKLPPVKTYDINVTKDIEITMPDGVVLLADHYRPAGNETLPTILIRTPYGRGGVMSIISTRVLAEQGFQVFYQSCRGTFGSGGEFNLLHQEKSDGLATVEWINKQDWFNGELATVGASYLGYVQWAIARDLGPMLKSMSLVITSSAISRQFFMGDSFAFQSHLGWAFMMKRARESSAAMFGGAKAVKKTNMLLPILNADEVASNMKIKIWQDTVINSEPEYEYWKEADHSGTVSEIEAPMNWVGGWYDVFLPWMMKDYESAQDAGRKPYLLIGPWAHGSIPLMAEGVRQSIVWNKAHFFGDKSGLRESPVRVFIMGSKVWKDFREWPPPGIKTERWNLQADGKLSPETPVKSEPSQYRYDPNDPTPNVGGPLMSPGWGPKDNRKLEARSDVLVFTSQSMKKDMEIIGPVKAVLYIRSSLVDTDFFARLCDVEPSGKSLNICDGLLRLRPGRPAPEPDGSIKVNIELWPTAYCFKKGHCIRLQVSSGAHPRFIRNSGSGEPIATAVKLVAADQKIYHDPDHLSAVILPVMA